MEKSTGPIQRFNPDSQPITPTVINLIAPWGANLGLLEVPFTEAEVSQLDAGRVYEKMLAQTAISGSGQIRDLTTRIRIPQGRSLTDRAAVFSTMASLAQKVDELLKNPRGLKPDELETLKSYRNELEAFLPEPKDLENVAQY